MNTEQALAENKRYKTEEKELKKPELNPFCINKESMTVKACYKANFSKAGNVDECAAMVMCNVITVDIDRRVSIYTSELLSNFKDLSSSAKDMFMYIGTKLQWNNDVIELKEEVYCSEMQITRNTYFRARRELINLLIIPRKSRKDTYFINPALMYNGNRVKAYPSNVEIINKEKYSQITALERNALNEKDSY